MTNHHPCLPPDQAERLRRRALTLAPLGSLLDDPAALPTEWTTALTELTDRLEGSYPFADPHYLGQMIKPPHPVAWAAYATAMLLNSNNHALDGGPATALLEREAVAQIAAMLGYETHLSHLTTSGTIANLEALWVARLLRPEQAVVSAANAHYTHARISEVVGARHETLPQTPGGQFDLAALEARLSAGGVGTVVATLGTTGLGRLDPIDQIADLCSEHAARLHVDAAYGGFFALLADDGDPAVDPAPFRALARADSIVIDPHKHGLQPYGCGCLLFRDPNVGQLYAHDSPYTYFTSTELHPGQISLECSRSGAAAAALWATLRALPLTRAGLGQQLAGARHAALLLAERIDQLDGWQLVGEPDLDIVCWYPIGTSAAEISSRSDHAFDRLARQGWHVAKLTLPSEHLTIDADQPTVTVLRSVLMKPEHVSAVDPFTAALANLR